MGTLTVSETRAGGVLTIHLNGDLSETGELAQLDLQGVDELRINCSKLGHINSAGLAGWIYWTRGIESQQPKKVVLEEVQPILIRVMTSVKDIVPARWRILSMRISYFCEACNQSTDRVVSDLSQVAQDAAKCTELLSYSQCAKCNAKIEIDDSVSRYVDTVKKYCSFP